MPPPRAIRRIFFEGGYYSDTGILQGRYLGKNFLFKNPRYLPCKIYNEKRGGINTTIFLGSNYKILRGGGIIPTGALIRPLRYFY